MLSKPNAQDEERAVCDCLNPFDVIAVALARHLLIGALLHPGRCPRGTRGHCEHLRLVRRMFLLELNIVSLDYSWQSHLEKMLSPYCPNYLQL